LSDLHILVVCLGNVCRSPLAEGVLRLRLHEMLGEAAHSVRVSSAGVLALVGEPMDSAAADQLRRLGGQPDGFVSRQVESRMVERADLVLTATRQLRSRLLEEAPRALKRVFTVREFSALVTSGPLRERRPTSTADLVERAASWRGSLEIEHYDVPDPIGQSQAFHRDVADLLDRDCTVIAKAVVAATLNDAS
jgi:protein-tyrosine phosphatase